MRNVFYEFCETLGEWVIEKIVGVIQGNESSVV